MTHQVKSIHLVFWSISCPGRSKKKDHCLNVELEQTETCPCDEVLSQPFGNWSACILPDPSAAGALKGWRSQREIKECGQGVRYRAVACVGQQGHLVDPTLCTDTGRNHKDRFEDEQHFSFSYKKKQLSVEVLSDKNKFRPISKCLKHSFKCQVYLCFSHSFI